MRETTATEQSSNGREASYIARCRRTRHCTSRRGCTGACATARSLCRPQSSRRDGRSAHKRGARSETASSRPLHDGPQVPAGHRGHEPSGTHRQLPAHGAQQAHRLTLSAPLDNTTARTIGIASAHAVARHDRVAVCKRTPSGCVRKGARVTHICRAASCSGSERTQNLPTTNRGIQEAQGSKRRAAFLVQSAPPY